MTRGTARFVAINTALLLVLLLIAGCAGSTNAQTASSLVRARPTTPLDTFNLQMDGALYTLHDALDRLAALLVDPHYLDDTWKSDAVNQATLVELGYRQLEGLAPPDVKRDYHAAALRAVQDCQTLTVYVFQGINNLDKRPFDEVKKRVDLCRSKLDEATGVRGPADTQGQSAGPEPAGQQVHVRVKRDANLRGGPATTYPVAATAAAGDTFTVMGRTPAGDWLQISGDKAQGVWIAAFLVEADGDLKSVAAVATPAPPDAVVAPTPPPPATESP